MFLLLCNNYIFFLLAFLIACLLLFLLLLCFGLLLFHLFVFLFLGLVCLFLLFLLCYMFLYFLLRLLLVLLFLLCFLHMFCCFLLAMFFLRQSCMLVLVIHFRFLLLLLLMLHFLLSSFLDFLLLLFLVLCCLLLLLFAILISKEISPVPTNVYTTEGVIINSDTINWNSTFSIACWCKPEAFAASGRGFVLYPGYGNKNVAKVGFSMGQNGISIYEYSDRKWLALKCEKPIEGWTHVCVVYDKGIPSLYINGKLVSTGEKSNYRCLPAIDVPMTDEQIITVFEGDNTSIIYYNYVLNENNIEDIYNKGLPPVAIKGKILYDLSNNWQVSFPEWTHAPEIISLNRLISLRKHDDFNVRHFSGTAVYKKTFYVSDNMYSDISGKNTILSLGRVENIAEVSINGCEGRLLWKAPYEIDVTNLLRKGENKIVIKVTNLYPNRIIGDEYIEEKYNYDEYGQIKYLPEWYKNNSVEKDRKRVLFIPWKHYKATDPLLESGLMGDVLLYKEK